MIRKENRSILFVGGGIETAPGIEAARALDLNIIVSDSNPSAHCVAISDHFLHADTYDIDATILAALKFCSDNRKIDAVICMATDVPLTVASVAQELGAPGIPVESARLVSDKILMKDCFKENSLPIPWYKEIFQPNDLVKIIAECGYPLIIKPVDSRGARGVLRITKDVDLEWAFITAKTFSPSNRVMVEEFLFGPQVSTESLVIGGKVHTIGFSDRNYELLEKYAPHIIENGGDLPSVLPLAKQDLICNTVEKTASALGITNGVIKGDMVLCDGLPFIIEVAARLSGGYFCSHEISLNTGVDFVTAAIKVALGDNVCENSILKTQNHPVSQRYFFPKPGVVKEINVPKWITENPAIKLCEVRVKVGDRILGATHHPARAGLVITTGKSREDARNIAMNVVDSIKIITE